MKVMKKPIALDAWDPTGEVPPSWALDAMSKGTISMDGETMTIKSMEGTHVPTPGAIVMKGVRGELYFCDRSIFEQTYDIIEDGSLV